MGISVKIWLLAAIYQTIIFSFLMGAFDWQVFILTLVALLISLPTLLVSEILITKVRKNNITAPKRWFILLCGISITSFLSLLITIVLVFSVSNEELIDSIYASMLSAVTTMVASLTLFASINKISITQKISAKTHLNH